MGYEIDFLPVGDGEKCGDAIALRYGNLFGHRDEQSVVIIDGGFSDSGYDLINHVQKYYNTSRVDLVISTHPDSDHVSGLLVVLDEMSVGNLWMHRPWNHTADIASMFRDGRVTDTSVSETLRKSLEVAYSLEQKAIAKGIPIIEPFAGVKDASGNMLVLGPTETYYEKLLPLFRGTPEPKISSLVGRAMFELREVVSKVAERFDLETLNDDGVTSAENNSSVILVAVIDGSCVLFSGDAGIPALTQVADLLESANFDMSNLSIIQIPHHGSQRNVGPSILNRIVGPKLAVDQMKKMAIVSASKDGEPKHPSKKVTNAFRRRGAHVFATKGRQFCKSDNAPDRLGWIPATELPLYYEVEE